MTHPNFEYYFIKEGIKSISFIKLNLAATLEGFKETAIVELEKMYVLPEMKGQGIGKIKDTGKKVFFLCVIDTNIAAIKFYEKLGFQFHSTTRLEVPFFKEELKGIHRMVLKFQN